MHELSIALSIVEIAEEEISKAGRAGAEEIVLEIGSLAGVDTQALDFAWKEAVLNTVLEKAACLIETIAGKARCLNCNSVFELSFLYDPCPFCQDFRKELLQGKEIRIKSIAII